MALLSMASIGILIRIAGSLNDLGIAKIYLLSSTIPSVIIYIWCMYTTIKKLHFNLQPFARRAFQAIFTFSFCGMMYYQYCEVTSTLDHSIFQHIILPRAIFILLFLQINYLALSTHIPCMMWIDNNTPKVHRIYTFFQLLCISVIPSLLMLAGEGQQILFLLMFLILVGTNYSLKEIGVSNCLLQYCFYSLIAQVMFQNTYHVLDYNAPRIQRAFVGFPIFNDLFTYTIGFFETTSVYTFLMMLVPVLTIESHSDYFLNLVEPSEKTVALFIQDVPIDEKTEKDDAQMRIIRNYLIILLHMGLIQIALTRYLVANFEEMFFFISPVEFTFRFMDWYVYILAFGLTFAIGSI